METLAEAIKAHAHALGFDLVGITGAEPSAFAAEYRDWIASGYAGEMEYLARNLERRLDPRELLPDARSIIVVGMNYYADAEEGPGTPIPDPERAVFARYARGDDYHEVMTARLRELLAFLKEQSGPEAEGRVYVDAGPVLEREVARPGHDRQRGQRCRMALDENRCRPRGRRHLPDRRSRLHPQRCQ